MVGTNIVCPNCSSTLKTAAPLAADKVVLCRRCGTRFSPHSGAGAGTQSPPGGTSWALLFGSVIAGAVLLLLLGSSAIVAYAVLHRPVANATTVTTGPAVAVASTQGTDQPEKPLEVINPIKPYEDKPVVASSPQDEGKIGQTVERGLQYLRNAQGPDGSWQDVHSLGLTALAGLALLECGAKVDDPQVIKAAEFVRNLARKSYETYALSLCILFLDRLGDSNDNSLIQTMAVRLISGQTPSGGWTYFCPTMSEQDERRLLELLREMQPARTVDPNADPQNKQNKNAPDRVEGSNDRVIPPVDKKAPDGPANAGGEVPRPKEAAPSSPDGTSSRIKPGMPREQSPPQNLPPPLRRLPILRPEDQGRRNGAENSDNSNTQFAVLAIWVAGRHDVPTERVGANIDRHFRSSQRPNGAWLYSHGTNDGSSAMTCAGLLGLAVGHGVRSADATTSSPGQEDEQIKKALNHLTELIGAPQSSSGSRHPKLSHNGVGLYFLWSVERVGVMYNLRTLGEKDWYAWGSQLILSCQNQDGSFTMGNYPGQTPSSDTCFALLFLKRANLARDLSRKIDYLIDIKGVGNRN